MKAAFSKAQFESELTSRFGAVIKPREKIPAAVMPTGIAEVDELSGGLPRGAITEIYGPASSGRTTLILHALAEATSREEVCAVVDTNNSFHPDSAANAGACLDRVLWIRCGSRLEQAFKATDLLLQGGGFGLVLLDLGEVPSQDSKRIISSWWYRFRRVVENTSTAFIVIAQDSCVRSCASLTLQMVCSNDAWSTTGVMSGLSNADKFPAVVGPTYFRPSPFHSHLFTGAQFLLERQKPVLAAERRGTFTARNSH